MLMISSKENALMYCCTHISRAILSVRYKNGDSMPYLIAGNLILSAYSAAMVMADYMPVVQLLAVILNEKGEKFK